MIKRGRGPFCPKCGKEESVISIKITDSWKCNSCGIKFEFSKLSYLDYLNLQMKTDHPKGSDSFKKNIIGPAKVRKDLLTRTNVRASRIIRSNKRGLK